MMIIIEIYLSDNMLHTEGDVSSKVTDYTICLLQGDIRVEHELEDNLLVFIPERVSHIPQLSEHRGKEPLESFQLGFKI